MSDVPLWTDHTAEDYYYYFFYYIRGHKIEIKCWGGWTSSGGGWMHASCLREPCTYWVNTIRREICFLAPSLFPIIVKFTKTWSKANGALFASENDWLPSVVLWTECWPQWHTWTNTISQYHYNNNNNTWRLYPEQIKSRSIITSS